jgi:hypothetical protein
MQTRSGIKLYLFALLFILFSLAYHTSSFRLSIVDGLWFDYLTTVNV